MPWSPIPKFPAIIRRIKSRGYTSQVNFEILRVSIMEETGAIKDNTISQTLKAMEDLGYIKSQGDNNIWNICQSKPRDFGKIEELKIREEEKIMDKMLDDKTSGA